MCGRRRTLPLLEHCRAKQWVVQWVEIVSVDGHFCSGNTSGRSFSSWSKICFSSDSFGRTVGGEASNKQGYVCVGVDEYFCFGRQPSAARARSFDCGQWQGHVPAFRGAKTKLVRKEGKEDRNGKDGSYPEVS